jgi:transcriptional regulator with XRE-family HTH domain
MEPATLIREARKAANLTQAQLAQRAGMSQSEIARLESNGANPRHSTLKRVVAAAGQGLSLELGGPPEVDETMIAANLRLSPEERLRQFEAAYRSIADLVSRARAG